jgi:hypothetical protein
MQNRMFGFKSLAAHSILSTSILSASIVSTRIDLTATSLLRRPRSNPRQLTTAGGPKPISGMRITDLLDHNNWQSSQLQMQLEGEARRVFNVL